jgi:MFS family permease
LIVGSALTVMAAIALAPVLPAMMEAFGEVPHANFWVPAVLSVAGLGGALSAPLAGLIGDRYGRRGPLIGFSALFALAGALPLVLDDFPTIFATRIIVGVACMGVLVNSTAMIGDLFVGPARDRWLAGQAVVATFSALLFMPVAGFLGAGLGWRGPFLLFLVGLPLAVAYLHLPHRSRADAASIEPPAGWAALPWPWLLRISLVFAGCAMLFYAVQMQIGLALAAVGVADPARIGLLSVVAVAGIPAGAIVFMKVAAQPFGRLIRWEVLISGATLMAMRHVDDYRAFLALAFVNLMANGMMIPTLMTHLTRHLEERVRARGIGISQAAFSAGQFLSVGATALVMQRPGATVLDAFWLLGLGGVAAAALSMLGLAARGRPQITA